jgi:hypothetical protein
LKFLSMQQFRQATGFSSPPCILLLNSGNQYLLCLFSYIAYNVFVEYKFKKKTKLIIIFYIFSRNTTHNSYSSVFQFLFFSNLGYLKKNMCIVTFATYCYYYTLTP